MQQLTGLDAAFLALETANATGHVGGVCVLDPRDAPQPLTLARLTDVLADRLPLVPVLRRKLLNVPLGLDQPYWIDDPDFDIEYHIREIALPRPGSDAQLTEQVARLHARPLDRSRPLWEIYLITGLAKRQGRGVHEDPPRRDRRRVRRGVADRAARPQPGRARGAAQRTVHAGQAARPGHTGRARRCAAGMAAHADRAYCQ